MGDSKKIPSFMLIIFFVSVAIFSGSLEPSFGESLYELHATGIIDEYFHLPCSVCDPNDPEFDGVNKKINVGDTFE
ncbi:MAG: hypothetical protein ACE5RI_10295, partial [Candidatus Nitrosomaritimum yanchengensis]